MDCIPYELANPILMKDLPVFKMSTYSNMMNGWINKAIQKGVDIGNLSVNSYVYEYDDPIFLVEYIKMVCNLGIIFRDIYDTELYNLRMSGYINNIYSDMDFNTIFNHMNTNLNLFLDQSFRFEETEIYHTEITLDISTKIYNIFVNDLITQVSKVVNINPLQLRSIFIRNKIKNIEFISKEIYTQLDNILSIY